MIGRCDLCGHLWRIGRSNTWQCEADNPCNGHGRPADWFCADFVLRDGAEAEPTTDELLARMPQAWTLGVVDNYQGHGRRHGVVNHNARPVGREQIVTGETGRAALLAAFARWPVDVTP